MPVVIGERASGFHNPLGLLSDCHRRIERFLAALVTITEQAGGRELDPNQRASLHAALEYFRNAAPKHTADEEESLFPRLRQSHSADIDGALKQLDELEADHSVAEQQHAEVDRLGRQWLNEGSITPEDCEFLRSTLRALEAMYRRHIEIEDRHLFPLAEKILPKDQQLLVGAEMAARRAVINPGSGPGQP